MARTVRLFIVAFVSLVIAVSRAKIPPEMITLMDNNVNPCEDFYQYSCGSWLKTHTLKPSDIQIDSSFTLIEENKEEILIRINKEDRPLLRELWDSCMALNKITNLGNQSLQKDLNRISHAKTIADALELAGEFSRTGSNAITKFKVGADTLDASINTFHIAAADLTLPISKYGTSFPEEYNLYINDLMELSGFAFSDDGSNRSVADIVVAIEWQIASIHKRQSEIRSMLILDVIAKWPITVGAYFKGLGLLQKTSIKRDLRVYVERTDYLDGVEKLIRAIPVQDLKVYIAFVMVHSRAQWLGDDFFQVWFKFFGQTINGQRVPFTRSKFCMDSLVQFLPDLIGQYYYRKTFDSEREDHVIEIINLIQEAMDEHISTSSWLTRDVQNAAKVKLGKVISLIGRSPVLKSYPAALSHYDYPTNVYTILSHSFDAEIKKIGHRVNRKEWYTSPATVNAFYVRQHNSMSFTAAILQPPFFDGRSVHPARNFGAIGVVIGHELTHGFDNNGRFYDGEGNLRQWWTESTSEEFKYRSQCIKDQYSAFEVLGEHNSVVGFVNGSLTLGENIADNGGISLAWDAYRKYMIRSNPNTYGVTPEEGDRMFFLAYGQSLCRKMRDQTMRQLITTNLHSPSQWRVNGVVMNNDAFAKVFKCKINTPMNPIKKCQLW